MCVSCFDLRARSVPENKASSTALQTAGLVLGFVSLLPLPAIILASLVVNIVGIVKVSDPGARAVRYRPIVGLVLTCLSAAGWLTLTFSAR